MPIENKDGELYVCEHDYAETGTYQYFAAYTPFEVDGIQYDINDEDEDFTPQRMFQFKTDYSLGCTGKDETCQCNVEYEVA